MKVYRVTQPGAADYVARSAGEMAEHLAQEMGDAEVGDSATLSIEEMDEARLASLPEWEP